MNYEPKNLTDNNNERRHFSKKLAAIIAGVALVATGCAKAEGQPGEVPASPSETATSAPTTPGEKSSTPTPEKPSKSTPGSLETVDPDPTTEAPAPAETEKPAPTPEQTPEDAEHNMPKNPITPEQGRDIYRNTSPAEVRQMLEKGDLEGYADLIHMHATYSTKLTPLMNAGYPFTEKESRASFLHNDPATMTGPELYMSSQTTAAIAYSKSLVESSSYEEDLKNPRDMEDALNTAVIHHLPSEVFYSISDDNGEYMQSRNRRGQAALKEKETAGFMMPPERLNEITIVGTGQEEIAGKTYDMVYVEVFDVNEPEPVTMKIALVPLSKDKDKERVYTEDETSIFVDNLNVYKDGSPVRIPVQMGVKKS